MKVGDFKRRVLTRLARKWSASVDAKTLNFEAGGPWESGYCKRFGGRPRDELLNSETSCSISEAQVLVEHSRQYYKTTRPHSAPGYGPAALQTITKNRLDWKEHQR